MSCDPNSNRSVASTDTNIYDRRKGGKRFSALGTSLYKQNHYANTVTQMSQCADQPARVTTEYMQIMTFRGHKGNRAQKFW